MNEDTGRKPNDHSRLIRIGILVAGVGSFAALVAMVLAGIQKVRLGRGLDTFRTAWLVEFNWIAFLVFMVVLVAALGAGAWLRYLEWRELEQLRARYANEKREGSGG